MSVALIGAEPAVAALKFVLNAPPLDVDPDAGENVACANGVDRLIGVDASAFPYASLNANANGTVAAVAILHGAGLIEDFAKTGAPAVTENALLVALKPFPVAVN